MLGRGHRLVLGLRHRLLLGLWHHLVLGLGHRLMTLTELASYLASHCYIQACKHASRRINVLMGAVSAAASAQSKSLYLQYIQLHGATRRPQDKAVSQSCIALLYMQEGMDGGKEGEKRNAKSEPARGHLVARKWC
jgi:hypothetical protein